MPKSSANTGQKSQVFQIYVQITTLPFTSIFLYTIMLFQLSATVGGSIIRSSALNKTDQQFRFIPIINGEHWSETHFTFVYGLRFKLYSSFCSVLTPIVVYIGASSTYPNPLILKQMTKSRLISKSSRLMTSSSLMWAGNVIMITGEGGSLYWSCWCNQELTGRNSTWIYSFETILMKGLVGHAFATHLDDVYIFTLINHFPGQDHCQVVEGP